MLDYPKIQLKTELTLIGIEYLINNQNLNMNPISGKILTLSIILKNLLAKQEIRKSSIYFFPCYKLRYKKPMKISRESKIIEQQNQSHVSRTSSTNSKINKRYLILSYKTDFEKVHYPLALNYEEHIENSRLMTKIQNLKTELLDHKSQKQNDSEILVSSSFSISKRDIQTFDSLVNQNELLKPKVKKLEETLTQKKGAVEVDQLIRDNEDLQNLLNTSKLLYEEKIQKLEQQIDLKSTEIVMQINQINVFKKELSSLIGQVETDNQIKKHIKLMNEDEESKLVKAQKTIQKYEKELESLNQQIDSLKKQDAVKKRRINQLETELSQSMKRYSYKGVTDRLYSPYSNYSNASRKSNHSVPNRANSNNSPGNASPNVRQTSPNLSKNSRSSVQYSVSIDSILVFTSETSILQHFSNEQIAILEETLSSQNTTIDQAQSQQDISNNLKEAISWQKQYVQIGFSSRIKQLTAKGSLIIVDQIKGKLICQSLQVAYQVGKPI
ncbi:unnamed protein product [Paramecium octaurelia]|uniref:Uncharacterized protein n=1 Tax=Paramecium octaurelia TaxID=43137 RepID=A0A8S1TZM3_PAROT|nr:unnamed protein product [Paramecium octaurelia]